MIRHNAPYQRIFNLVIIMGNHVTAPNNLGSGNIGQGIFNRGIYFFSRFTNNLHGVK